MYSIIILSLSGLVTLFLGFLKSKNILLPATLFAILLALGAGLTEWNEQGVWFNGMFQVSNLSIGFSSVILLTALLIMAMTGGFQDDEHAQPAEYYAIIQFSLVGAIMMTGFKNLTMLFVGVEILSVSMYVLTGSDKRNLRGNEAAIKYFLMGAFATGILLFGMAMLYGATNLNSKNALDITSLTQLTGNPLNHSSITLYIGLTMLLLGLLFKVSAAPFHFWTADVYDGAPTIFTLFMSAIVKTAGFAAIYRIVSVSFTPLYSFWWLMILVMLILTLVISNITAVSQQNFKRMLAFSSISHAGYLLLSILGLNEHSDSSILFYSLAYCLATVSAFGVLMVVSKEKLSNGRPDESLDALNGLAKRNTFLAVVLAISMMSLAGIPLTAGFWGKFFVFSDAASRKHVWVLVVAVLMSAVGIYYYFRPIIAAFMKSGEQQTITVKPYFRLVLTITTILTILLGILPNLVRGLI